MKLGKKKETGKKPEEQEYRRDLYRGGYGDGAADFMDKKIDGYPKGTMFTLPSGKQIDLSELED